MSLFKSLHLLLAFILAFSLFSACDLAGDDEDENDTDEVKTEVEEILGSEVTEFQIREINVEEVTNGLESGEATIPFATPNNEIRELTLPSQSANLRPDDVKEGAVRQEDQSTQMVPLPPLQNFYVGECRQPEVFDICGGLTILDDARTMLRGLVRHSDFGVSYIQSVNHVLETDKYPDLHVIYNMENTVPIDFPEDESTNLPGRR